MLSIKHLYGGIDIPTTNYCADTSQADKELDQLQRTAQMTAASVARAVRRSYATLSLFVRSANIAIDASLDLLIQSMFLFSEALATQATAEGFLGSPRALVLFGFSTMMFYRAVMLQGERSDIADAFDNVLTGFNIWI